MANFPQLPTVGDVFSTSNVNYTWTGVAWEALSAPGSSLDDLDDVSSASATSNQGLKWNGSAWVPTNLDTYSQWTQDGSGTLHPADLSGAQTVVIGGTDTSNSDIVLNAANGDITSVGNTTSKEFSAEMGVGVNQGYGFGTLDKDKAGIQVGSTSKELSIKTQDSVKVYLDSDQDSTTSRFSVSNAAGADAFYVKESGDAEFGGDVTADSFVGSGASLTSIPTTALTGTITNDKLTGGITNDKLAGGITNDKLVGGITNDKLAGGITNEKLAGGITNVNLAGGITNAKLAGGITNDKLAGGITGSQLDSTYALDSHDHSISDLTVPTDNVSWGSKKITGLASPDQGTDAANRTYVDAQVSGLVDGAPGLLNTLKELSDALGADENYAATTTALINGKAPTVHDHDLNELNDFDVTTPSGGSVLVYDDASGETDWKNKALSGDVTMTKGGVVTIAANAVENSMLVGGITNNKLDSDYALDSHDHDDDYAADDHAHNISTVGGIELTSIASGQVLIYYGTTDKWRNKSLTGDVAITTEGAVTIGAGKVSNAMLEGSITDSKLDSDYAADDHNHTLNSLTVPDGDVSLNSKNITNLATPTADSHAATKAYTDAGLATKAGTGHDHDDDYAAEIHTHTGAQITSGDISLTGEITAGEFSADMGSDADDGFGFGTVDKNMLGIQGHGNSVFLMSKHGVYAQLDRDWVSGTTSNAEFRVTSGSGSILLSATESGVTTSTTFSGSGADLTDLPVDELDGAVGLTKGGTGAITAQLGINALTAINGVTPGKILTVSSGGDAAWEEGGAGTFSAMTDTPGSITASRAVYSNSAGNALEYVDHDSDGHIFAKSNVAVKAIPTVGKVGGVGLNIREWLTEMFYPFLPATLSFSSESLQEFGKTTNTKTLSGQLTDNDEDTFTNNTFKLKKEGNLVTTFSNPTGDTGWSFSQNLQPDPASGRTVDYSIELGVGNDGSPITLSTNRTVSFAPPTWHAWDTSTMTPTEIMASSSHKHLYSNNNSTHVYDVDNEYMHIAYPKEYGVLTSVKDSNNFEYWNVATPALSYVNSSGNLQSTATHRSFTLQNGQSVDYYVYRWNNLFTSSGSGFSLTFT